MPVLISAHQLEKTFGARPVFEGVTFSVESGERIGLIGPNGAGKSTLLRVLSGQASPDQGTVSFQRGLKVGYLEQVPAFTPGATALSTVLEAFGEAAAEGHTDWENVAAAEEALARLSLERAKLGPESKIETMSGGWKKRVALARELARRPDVLLLDEPTNHLDVESIVWLEELIENASFATLTITHDRLFLQRVSSRILELDRRNPGGLLSVAGAYSDYLEVKEQLLASQERREQSLKNTLRRETEWLRRGAKARTTKQQARIQRAETLKDDVAELEYRNQSKTVRLEFSGTEKNPKRLLEARGLAKSLGGKSLFNGLDLFLGPGTRIGLLGPNGSGKSTLLRVLLGEQSADAGEVLRAEGLKVAYFEQSRETLDPTKTVLKTVCPAGDFVDYRGGRLHVRSYLDRFLFPSEQSEMAVGKLSGGEQARLLLARLMLQEANLLVLDEPTNDLDLATLSVLEDCLVEFPGAILLVTHDRYLLDRVSTRVLGFTDEGVISFAGLDQWEAWQAERETQKRAKAKAAVAQAKEAPKKPRKLSFNEQRELDGMEAKILATEGELAELGRQSALPENTANAPKLAELTARMSELHAEIDRLYVRWAELSRE